MGRRRAWVLFGVQLLILLHIALWLWWGRTLSPLEPSESMAFAKEGLVTPGFLLFVGAIVATFLFGRFFCGWGCHLLALQDGYRWVLKRLGIPIRPFRSRLLRLVPVAAFIYMFVWPYVLRFAARMEAPVPSMQMTTTAFWQTFPGFWEGLLTFVLAGAYVVQLMGSKAFCAYACPYGAALAVADSFSPASIRVTDACQQCGKCTAVCSSGVQVHEEVRDFGMVISTDCMKTLDCVAACPNQALVYHFGVPAVFKKRRASGKISSAGIPSWGEELLLAAFFALGFWATQGLYGSVSFLLSLALGMVCAMYGLQVFRALGQKNYRPGRKAWRQNHIWTRYGRLRFGFGIFVLALFLHSAYIQFHSQRRDAAFADTSSFRNAWLRGEVSLPAPAAVLAKSEEALTAQSVLARWGLFADARNPFVRAWDTLFHGDTAGFESGLQEVLRQRPGFGEVLFQLGRHQSLLGRPQEAMATWRQISARDPRYFDAQLEILYELRLAGQANAADKLATDLINRGYPRSRVQGRILPDEAAATH